MTPLLAILLLATPEAPSRPPPLVELATAADARRLCEALTPAEREPVKGTAVDRGEAEVRRDAEREAALASRYRVVLPGERLRFGTYSADDRVLALRRDALPPGAGGAVRLGLVEDPTLPVEVDPATARRILAAQGERKLALAVTFVLPEAEEAPCFGLAGAPARTFAAEPVSWEYRAGDTVLARGGEGSERPPVSAKEGATPRVSLGGGVDDAPALRGAVTARLPRIERCYRSALDRDPWLDGAIVADLEPGRADGVRIAADSVQDDGLVGCVRGVLAEVVPRGGARAFLPIHFALDPPGAGGGGGQ